MRARKANSIDEIPYVALKEKQREGVHFVTPDVAAASRAPMWCVILYIACVMLGCLGDSGRMPGSLGMYMKAASLGAVALAGYQLVKTGNAKGLVAIGRFSLVFIAPLLLTLLISLLIWIINTESLSAISRGSQKLIFQFINIFSVLSAAYLFKEKIILYFFIGLIGGNALICLMEIPTYGIVGSIQSLFEGILHDNAYGFMSAIEIHDITFAAGAFTLYFFTVGRKEKNGWLLGIIALIFFIIGFKRIAIPGCLVAIALWWFIKTRKRRTRIRLVYLISFGIVLAGFGYILSIKQGLFIAVMQEMGVDMMGRERIYPYLEQFYTIDPTYIGYGFEYTVAMLRGMRDAGTQVIHVTAIHNDILKLYIELGFWGYWAWMLYVYVYQTHWYMKHYGESAARLMLVINLYSFMTYLTDNTTYYFWFSMGMRVLMIGYAYSAEVVAGRKREQEETGLLTAQEIRRFAGDED